MAEALHVDYLVIGAGGMGLGFVDTLLTESQQKTFAIVDRYARPSGHWTVAYPHVRLHQPSFCYGVNSRHLGNDAIDKVGFNKGLYELASRDEICAYYDVLMNDTFLPSGRVHYFPKHEWDGGREFHSIMTGKRYQVGPNTRIVDSTFMMVTVPSMRPPQYDVKGVEFVTPNDLTTRTRPYANYTVIGAGKTSMDACIWLISNGIEPSNITWIRPRDPFLFGRENFQNLLNGSKPGMAQDRQKKFIDGVMNAKTLDDLVKGFVAGHHIFRLDDNVWPTTFRCAIISQGELAQLKKITNVVRMGRVVRITEDEVQLEKGTYKPDPDTLFIDCTADGLPKREAKAVFEDDMIRLQAVRMCIQGFSASFIGHVEAQYEGNALKNKFCRPISHPDRPEDLPLVQMETQLNRLFWLSHPKTAEWLRNSRLDSGPGSFPVPKDLVAAQAVLKEVAPQLEGAWTKLKQLMEGTPQGEAAARFDALGGTAIAVN